MNPGVEQLLSFFDYAHLPVHLQEVSVEFYSLAHLMVDKLGSSPELTAGLRKLLEAKDCFVRQAVIDYGDEVLAP